MFSVHSSIPDPIAIKNFDTFEANTTYLIWVRSSIVFAFKAETLTEDGMIIS